MAISRAIDLIVDQHAIFHLLHVYKPSKADVSFSEAGKAATKTEASAKLEEWKDSIEAYLPSAEVFCWVIPALSVQNAIADKASELTPDLIIIGKKSNHYFLPVLNKVRPSVLKEKTGRPVLTVRPGSMHHRIKSVVIPISNDKIDEKIKAISALSKKIRLKIFLITFASEQGAEMFSSSAFLKIYQWVSKSLNCQVEHATVFEKNRAKAILNFSKKFDADVLLLDMQTETKIGWPGRNILDAIPAESKMQVLTL